MQNASGRVKELICKGRGNGPSLPWGATGSLSSFPEGLLAEKRSRQREDMLVATERELAKVAAMVEQGAAGGRAGLRGAAAIGERVGRVINKYQMAKHFTRTITDTSFTYVRNQGSIGEERTLEGLYVLRTNVLEEQPHLPLHRASGAGASAAVPAGLLGAAGDAAGAGAVTLRG